LGFLAAIITLSIIILLALLINRIATAALMSTGMSREMARFQARSAFSTVGFTTTEAESVVKHPVRRRIIAFLMLMGNAGFVGLIATVLGTFTGEAEGLAVWKRGSILAVVLTMLWLIGTSKWLDAWLHRITNAALKRWTNLEARDFLDLLHVGEGYSITELIVDHDDWLMGRRLDELRLSDIGINVLGIQKTGGDYIAAPTGTTYINEGDKLLLYGSRKIIIALDKDRSDPEEGKKHRERVEAFRRQWQREADNRAEGYAVTELVVRKEGWLADKRLDQLRFTDIGVVVLGIERKEGLYVGSPTGSERIQGEDKLIVYGSQDNLAALEESRYDSDGEKKHLQLVAEKRAERLKLEEKKAKS
jgi:Trk K+ transport system NAD-binding subunit